MEILSNNLSGRPMTEDRRFPLAQGAGWLIAGLFLEASAVWLLNRLKRGRLFLFRLPWDAPASALEVAEAGVAARFYHLPALVVIAVLCGLAMIAWNRRAAGMAAIHELLKSRRWLIGLFLLCTIADMATTLIFFHRDGVDHELHPGIRLVSYSLGRTVGPLVTKVIQFTGVLLVASLSKAAAPYVIGAAGVIYLLGAAYNVWVSYTY
jgi:hypothetical protein